MCIVTKRKRGTCSVPTSMCIAYVYVIKHFRSCKIVITVSEFTNEYVLDDDDEQSNARNKSHLLGYDNVGCFLCCQLPVHDATQERRI
jgi:hypothetical protein